MIKAIIKEIVIMLLLCIVILLILGILFYENIPTSRTIPVKEAYETPENIKQELNEEITELNTVQSELYEVTDADLNIYKKSSIYKPGKANPFLLEVEENVTVETNSEKVNGNSNNNNGSANNVSSENKDSNSNSTQTFFNDTK